MNVLFKGRIQKFIQTSKLMQKNTQFRGLFRSEDARIILLKTGSAFNVYR
jgi:hypothetical protein